MAASPTMCACRWTGSTARSSNATTRRSISKDVDGILVPGGFGERGTEGKIQAVQIRPRAQVPFFGICYGLHMAVIEAARDLAGLEGAGSTRTRSPRHPVIALMTEWTKGNEIETRTEGGDLGGTMRLGAYPAVLTPGSRVARDLWRDGNQRTPSPPL